MKKIGEIMLQCLPDGRCSSIPVRLLRLPGGVSLRFAKYRWLCLQARTSQDKRRI